MTTFRHNTQHEQLDACATLATWLCDYFLEQTRLVLFEPKYERNAKANSDLLLDKLKEFYADAWQAGYSFKEQEGE